MTAATLFKVLPEEPAYNSALALEARAWGLSYGPNPQDHRLRQAYQNEIVTGDPDQDVVRWIADKYGPFGRCCSLGCGTGRVERRLLATGAIGEMYACDASSAALEVFLREAPGNKRGEVADLNFIKLEENAFDLVVVWESLHHVINIEHLLYQVARSLKPNGLFLVRDFIGETRWQWSTEKRIAVNAIVRRIVACIAGAPVEPIPRWSRVLMSPFESIRSGEIAGLVRSAFGETVVLEKRSEALCHDALGLVDYRRPGAPLDEAMAMLIDADRHAVEWNTHRPCMLFGLYRKPASPRPIPVRRWPSHETRRRLDTTQYLAPSLRARLRAKRRLQAAPGGARAWSFAARMLRSLGLLDAPPTQACR